MKESEKVLEKKLKLKVKLVCGWAIKFPALHLAGIPDQICLFPKGKIYFVEMKSTGEKPSPIQLVIHKKLRAFGFQVFVIDSTEGINEFIELVKNER